MMQRTVLREGDLPQQNSRAPNQDLLLETSVYASCNNLTPVYQNEKHAKVYHMLDRDGPFLTNKSQITPLPTKKMHSNI